MRQHIHIWHLEIKNPEREPGGERAYRLERASNPSPEFARYLYVAVGARWLWYMRLDWTRRQWQERFATDNIELWVAFDGANPIGYFELERQAGGSVEICYFGLVPAYIGHGYGRQLLEDAISRAAALGGNRVWLHTCTLDHENALANYQARGFTVFREEDVVEDVPDAIEPWPGANPA